MADDVEAKFLAAIAASPMDHEARSVYADWLDERGDPRGVYLRLEQQLHEIPSRLATLAMSIDQDWIAAVARRFDVWLDLGGPMKISCVKAIREVTGLGLAEAKGMADAVGLQGPQLVITDVGPEEGARILATFADARAVARLVPHRAPASVYPGIANAAMPELEFYDVEMRAVRHGMLIDTIKAVRQLTGLGLAEAKAIVDAVVAGRTHVVLARVDAVRAREAAALLTRTCEAQLRAVP